MAIKRGDIYFVELNPVRGREQAGRRPVLVLSVDEINRLPLVVTVVVGTSGKNVRRDYSTIVRLSSKETGLPEETVFLCFQIRSLDPQRFPKKRAARVSLHAMQRIEVSVRYCLGL
jgi:mRNA interferase MazF